MLCSSAARGAGDEMRRADGMEFRCGGGDNAEVGRSTDLSKHGILREPPRFSQ